MDFSLAEDQIALRGLIIDFARTELKEEGGKGDEAGEFPFEAWHKCGDFGLCGLPFPERYGGRGADFLTTVLGIEAFGYACKDAGLVHAVVTQILCGQQIYLFGSEEQKNRYLPSICCGDRIAAQAITEPDSGSDALAMRTRGERSGETYLLNGTKMFISNGPVADLVIVFAVTNPKVKSLSRISSIIVEKPCDGFQQCPPIEKMGLRTLQNGELVFENCRVPAANLLGREGQGAIIFGESMEWERALMPAAHLGTMERVLEECLAYAQRRVASGRPVGRYQSVANKLVDLKIGQELGRLMLFKAATLKDAGKRAALESSMAKLFISESLKKGCLDAIQIHGGYGYRIESGIERDARDSIAATIYSGTSEMQRNLISKMLGL
jgi:alkylation response protein AidB-like acyl-CoA dehydrogenase